MENIFSAKSMRKMFAGFCWSYIVGSLLRKILEKNNIVVKGSPFSSGIINLALFLFFISGEHDNSNIIELPAAQIIDFVTRASGALGKEYSNTLPPLSEILIGCVGTLVILCQYYKGDNSPDSATARAEESASSFKPAKRRGPLVMYSNSPAGGYEGQDLFPPSAISEPQAYAPTLALTPSLSSIKTALTSAEEIKISSVVEEVLRLFEKDTATHFMNDLNAVFEQQLTHDFFIRKLKESEKFNFQHYKKLLKQLETESTAPDFLSTLHKIIKISKRGQLIPIAAELPAAPLPVVAEEEVAPPAILIAPVLAEASAAAIPAVLPPAAEVEAVNYETLPYHVQQTHLAGHFLPILESGAQSRWDAETLSLMLYLVRLETLNNAYHSADNNITSLALLLNLQEVSALFCDSIAASKMPENIILSAKRMRNHLVHCYAEALNKPHDLSRLITQLMQHLEPQADVSAQVLWKELAEFIEAEIYFQKFKVTQSNQHFLDERPIEALKESLEGAATILSQYTAIIAAGESAQEKAQIAADLKDKNLAFYEACEESLLVLNELLHHPTQGKALFNHLNTKYYLSSRFVKELAALRNPLAHEPDKIIMSREFGGMMLKDPVTLERLTQFVSRYFAVRKPENALAFSLHPAARAAEQAAEPQAGM